MNKGSRVHILLYYCKENKFYLNNQRVIDWIKTKFRVWNFIFEVKKNFTIFFNILIFWHVYEILRKFSFLNIKKSCKNCFLWTLLKYYFSELDQELVALTIQNVERCGNWNWLGNNLLLCWSLPSWKSWDHR